MEIIGEKINATRTDVEKAIRERNAAFIQDLARKQAEAGATYLDVNSGLALYPEEEAADFAWLIPIIQRVTDLPLCIDSGRPQPIEEALKRHRGQTMINSVNGDRDKMEEIFPLVNQYGCKVIALTSSKKEGIPASSMERVKIAETIAVEAQKYGIPLDDIYFDPLVLTLSTDHRNGILFLETLRGIKEIFKNSKTVSGLSNISFGLPRRSLINQAFLLFAMESGMDAAILDPMDNALMAAISAGEALMGRDPFCAGYLRAFREGRLSI